MNRAALVLLGVSCAAGCKSRDPPAAVTSVSTLDSLVALGEQVYRREEYDSARLLLSSVAARARVTGDSAAEARALTWLGLAAWRLGDYAHARSEQERALALKLALRLDHELWRSYNALGLVAWNEGRLPRALTRFAEASAAAQRVGDTVGVGSTAGNVGLVQTELGDFAAARRGFLHARDIGRQTSNARVEGNAHTNLGMLEIRVGNLSAALVHLTEALRLYQVADYATGRQNALGQAGTAYAALGDPQRALAALDSALTEARELGVQQDEASDLEAIAEQHRLAGDYRRALELYAEARTINRKLGLAVELGTDLRNAAEIHTQLGDLAVATRDAREALASHQAAGARGEQLADYLLLAEISDRAGDRADADRYVVAAQRGARVMDTRVARVSLALGAARIADRRREARRVLSVLDAAAADLAGGGYDTEWEAYALRARALTRLGRLEAAAREGRRAVTAVERVRSTYASGLLRTAYIADRSVAYAELATVLERLGRVDEAFEVSDAARGRALLERVAAEGDSAADATVVGVETRAALLAQIEGLVVQVEQFTRRYDPADPQVRAGLAELDERLGRARGQYERLVAGAPSAGTGAALLGAVPTSAVAVRGALRADEALVEYLQTPDAILGFVVTPQRITLFRSRVNAENLRSRVRLARDLLSRRSERAGDGPVLAGLYAALIEPARLSPGVRRLIVVPHGALAYLPFATLRDTARNQFLAELYSILYLPSAGALPALRGRGDASARAGRAAVFAPFPDRLPATALEAQALRVNQGAVASVGANATEARFRRALAQAGVVHAATHGVLNARNPLFSRIEFASRSSTDPQDDGRLEVHELLDLSIASPLVFLSGCETGLGTAGATGFTHGDDFATLAQAFLYGGAGNVVATLWRVEDEGAAAFAERFYAHLGQVAPPEALAAAQRDLMQGSRYRTPYYWGGYVVSGAGDLGRLAQSEEVVSVKRLRQPLVPQ